MSLEIAIKGLKAQKKVEKTYITKVIKSIDESIIEAETNKKSDEITILELNLKIDDLEDHAKMVASIFGSLQTKCLEFDDDDKFAEFFNEGSIRRRKLVPFRVVLQRKPSNQL